MEDCTDAVTEPLYYLEMMEPNSDVWKRLEPAGTKDMCEGFCMIAIAPAIKAGCKFRMVPATVTDELH